MFSPRGVQESVAIILRGIPYAQKVKSIDTAYETFLMCTGIKQGCETKEEKIDAIAQFFNMDQDVVAAWKE